MAKRVYFGFHHDDVISFRANVVRNHNAVSSATDDVVFFDASIWEEAKTKGEEALKRLINGGLDRTSVTCILIGTETYSRKWVRYEIFKSLQKGNKLIGIYIHKIKDKDGKTATKGPNPFEHLALKVSDDGPKVTPCTLGSDGKWYTFDLVDPWKPDEALPVSDRGKIIKLSRWADTHDWVDDDGYKNFGNWIA
ncbi:hypothetical protein BH09SUM1_BH09SUM1_01160 [soil metagenome]